MKKLSALLLLVSLGVQGGVFAAMKRLDSAPVLSGKTTPDLKHANSVPDIKRQANAASIIKTAVGDFAAAEEKIGSNAAKIIVSLTGLKSALAAKAANVTSKKLAKSVPLAMLADLQGAYKSYIAIFRAKTSVQDSAKKSLSVAYLSPSRDLPIVLELLGDIRSSLNTLADLAVKDGTTFIEPFDSFVNSFKGTSQADSAAKYINNMAETIEKASLGSSAESVIAGLKALNISMQALINRVTKSDIKGLGTPGDVDRTAYKRYEVAFNDFMKRLDQGTTNVKQSPFSLKGLKSKLTVAYLTKEDIANVRTELLGLSDKMKKFMPLLGFSDFENQGWYVFFAGQIADFKTDDHTKALDLELRGLIVDLQDDIGSKNPITGIRDEEKLLKKLSELNKALAAKVTDPKTAKIVQKAPPAQFALVSVVGELIKTIDDKITFNNASNVPLVQADLLKVINMIKNFYVKAYNTKLSKGFAFEIKRLQDSVAKFTAETPEDVKTRAETAKKEEKASKKKASALKAAQEKERLLAGDDIAEPAEPDHDLI